MVAISIPTASSFLPNADINRRVLPGLGEGVLCYQRGKGSGGFGSGPGNGLGAGGGIGFGCGLVAMEFFLSVPC